MKETNIDCMKYRKSTHLAGVDVETIIAEKGNCIVTIKECYYAKGVDVSGNKTDGYFLEFVEDLKGMVVNSINRKTISTIVKTLKNITSAESRNIGTWAGVQIELTFDPNVKMMGQLVGGIRVKPISPTPQISDNNAISILNTSTSLDELKSNWSKLTQQEQQLPTVVKLKDELKNKLK
jgi:hypothetical protein